MVCILSDIIVVVRRQNCYIENRKKGITPQLGPKGLVKSVISANLSCYLIDTVQKLGF